MALLQTLRHRYETWLLNRRLTRLHRQTLTGTDIAIISNNCVGSLIVKDLGLRYNSPTVDLFFFMPDYLNFLENLPHYLSLTLKPATTSKYGSFTYPIGLLDDVEIHFLHYPSFAAAQAKWEQRKTRLAGNRLFILGSNRDHCTPELIERFDKLPYPNKLFLSSKPYPHLKSVLFFPDSKHCADLPNGITTRSWLKYLNVVHWLNTGQA